MLGEKNLHREARTKYSLRPSIQSNGKQALFVCLALLLCFIFPSGLADGAASATLIQAHAGASRLAPENTRAAFFAAKKVGADGVETDIRMTGDHRLVLRHDDAIDGTSNGHGNISEMTLDELKAYDFGSWYGREFAGEPILTLEEFLQIAKELDFKVINLEMKPTSGDRELFVHLLADSVAHSGLADRIIVSSFDGGLLHLMKEYAPEVHVALLTVPNLSAISMLNLSKYLPAEKALADYTPEDLQNVPAAIAMALRAFGVHGDTPEEIILGVAKDIADIAPLNTTWRDVEAAIQDQKNLPQYVERLDFTPDYLNCHYNCLSQKLMDAMRARNIKVNVWTPDTEFWLKNALSFRPDGIITNQPEMALKLLHSSAGGAE